MPDRASPISPGRLERVLAAVRESASIEFINHAAVLDTLFYTTHRHSDLFQVHYILNGRDRVKISNRAMDIHEGDAVFINPRVCHGVVVPTRRVKLEYLFTRFSCPRLCHIPLPPVLFVRSRQEFADAFHRLVHEYHMNRPYRQTALRSYLEQMLFILFRELPRGRSGPSKASRASTESAVRNEKNVAHAVNFIRRNYRHNLRLDDIASETKVSVSTLSHIFRDKTGLSPIEYLVRYRLSQALALMQDRSLKLTAVADQCGFANVSYFFRAFRTRYNAAPREYAANVYRRG